MLTHLKLENFKIWQSTGPLRLAPITLLLGTNSSGKSSLTQSLLLIRQTAKGDDASLDLNFGSPDAGDSVVMGQFRDVLCRHAQATETVRASQFGIEFRWQPDGKEGEARLFSARYQKGLAGSAELSYLRIGADGEGFTVQRRKRGIYRLTLASHRRALGQSADYRPRHSFAFSAAALVKLGDNAVPIRSTGQALLDELSRIIYLGPVRRLAQRDYLWSGRMPAHIGDDGARAIDVLIASADARRRARRRGAGLPAAANLIEQVEHWLRKMELADGLRVRQLGSSAHYELRIVHHGGESNVRDVGVGVSQVLPVIVAALYARPGHIVIVEEPESHLHPLAQSALAELFATVGRERNVQFIVETHSEHLFRRMQTLIAKENMRPDDCALYFAERDGDRATLRNLAVDAAGRITNWPDHFFGDALGETREQARLMFERQRRQHT